MNEIITQFKHFAAFSLYFVQIRYITDPLNILKNHTAWIYILLNKINIVIYLFFKRK